MIRVASSRDVHDSQMRRAESSLRWRDWVNMRGNEALVSCVLRRLGNSDIMYPSARNKLEQVTQLINKANCKTSRI